MEIVKQSGLWSNLIKLSPSGYHVFFWWTNQAFRYLNMASREVSLHVKHERVRVTSQLGAQFRYTSRPRTLLGFVTCRDVCTEKQGHRYQQMTQQFIKRARKQ